MGVMSSAYRGRPAPPACAEPAAAVTTPAMTGPHQGVCGRWCQRPHKNVVVGVNTHKQTRAGDIPGATLGSAATPATGGGRQISPITPSAPGTSLTGRAFGPT